MRMLIFGATGRTGRELTALAAAGGWHVQAAGRDPAKLAALTGAAETVVADLADPAGIARAVAAAAPDAIVTSIGGALPDGRLGDEVGNIAISRAALAAGVRRLLQISSLACGDSRQFASPRIVAAIGPVLEAKTRAEDHLRALDLDWTVLRPGGLRDGEATGQGAVYDDPRVHGMISRAELARVVLDVLATPASIRRTLSTVERTTLPPEPAGIREFALTTA